MENESIILQPTVLFHKHLLNTYHTLGLGFEFMLIVSKSPQDPSLQSNYESIDMFLKLKFPPVDNILPSLTHLTNF